MKSTQHPNIAEVWAKFLKDKSEELRNILLEHYLPIVNIPRIASIPSCPTS